MSSCWYTLPLSDTSLERPMLFNRTGDCPIIEELLYFDAICFFFVWHYPKGADGYPLLRMKHPNRRLLKCVHVLSSHEFPTFPKWSSWIALLVSFCLSSKEDDRMEIVTRLWDSSSQRLLFQNWSRAPSFYSKLKCGSNRKISSNEIHGTNCK
jgi:hypothetical protein